MRLACLAAWGRRRPLAGRPQPVLSICAALGWSAAWVERVCGWGACLACAGAPLGQLHSRTRCARSALCCRRPRVRGAPRRPRCCSVGSAGVAAASVRWLRAWCGCVGGAAARVGLRRCCAFGATAVVPWLRGRAAPWLLGCGCCAGGSAARVGLLRGCSVVPAARVGRLRGLTGCAGGSAAWVRRLRGWGGCAATRVRRLLGCGCCACGSAARLCLLRGQAGCACAALARLLGCGGC